MPSPRLLLSAKTLRCLLSTIIATSILAFWLVKPGEMHHASAQSNPKPFRNFESPQVHPLAITPDGTRLLAVNSPNASLSVFQLTSGSPVLTAEIPVGLEPVSVAARNDREAWVVNWLSDSVSIVDLTMGNVVRTIDVGDEPTDVLFAGTSSDKAFVCVSGGGVTNGIMGGSGVIKIFALANLDTAPQVINIPGKQPRALARNASGSAVYVSVFESGNQTTIVPGPVVRDNGGLPPPSPGMRAGLPAAPFTGLIVGWNGSAWADETGKSWSPFLPYTLADIDLVVLNAASNPVVAGAQARGIGTHAGNMAFDPATGRLFVANLESTNAVRFEPKVRSRFQQSRITILDTTSAGGPLAVLAHDLNAHVNFSNPAGTDAERAQSLAMPADIVRISNGRLYVAATSSAKVGLVDPSSGLLGAINVGRGPTGLALDEARQSLYVLNRFDQTVSVVNILSNSQVSQVSIGFNPEPQSVREGRRFLYDGGFSAHGTVSCASCHLSGHRDGLAWDLGDPQGNVEVLTDFKGAPVNAHPMKGPMTTQSLRGLTGVGPLHWRGDRAGIRSFNPAFVSLLGATRQLSEQEMNAFEAFVTSLTYPPNPNEPLDRSLTPQAARGRELFMNEKLDGAVSTCNECHALDTFGTNGRILPNADIRLGQQPMKNPQLRGLYQKTGMDRTPGEKRGTGFGFVRDGEFDTVIDFLRREDFVFHPGSEMAESQRRDVENLVLTLDTGTAPAVGLMTTVNGVNKNSAEVVNRIQLLVQRSAAGDCDLVVRGLYGGRPRGFLRLADGTFQPDSLSEAPVKLQQLTGAVGQGAELTFTGVPPGEGRRFALDRDGDGILNDDGARASVSITGRVVDASGNGVGGVIVRLSGTQAATAQTDSTGAYAFNFVSTTGAHTVIPEQSGVNFTPQSRTFVNPSWNGSAIFLTSAAVNASDATTFFVRQHYLDFFNRDPDDGGLQFWTNQIESCGADAQCRELRRINVSAAFYLSIEFQETGFLVYRAAKAAFGDLPGKPVPITYQQLMLDGQRVGRNVVVGTEGWQAQLEVNKQAFFKGFVRRPDFLARFPEAMSGPDLAAALNSNAGSVLTQEQLDVLVSYMAANNTTEGRADAVRFVAESAELVRREKNRAFVLMQYFGYLRRNPNDPPEAGFFDGFNFWLGKLNQFNGNFVNAEMVKAFIVSGEYRQRFGP